MWVSQSFIKVPRSPQWTRFSLSAMHWISQVRGQRQRKVCFGVGMVVVGILLMSCSSLSSGGPSTDNGNTSTAQSLALTQLHWCGKVLMIFRDEGAAQGTATVVTSVTSTPTVGTGTVSPTPVASATATTPTPTTLNNWEQVKANLGFTPYLPATLPSGTCLVSAYGMVHDATLGGSFTIGYLLPNHSAITFSEIPLNTQNNSVQFQCNAASSTGTGSAVAGTAKGGTPATTPDKTQLPLQVCTGAHGTTSIVFSARGTTATLRQLFNALQPDVTWIPATT